MRPFRDPKGCSSFKVPVYAGRVVIALTRDTYNNANKALEDYEQKPESLKGCVGQTNVVKLKDGSTIYVVGLFENRMAVLVHELVHVVFRILSECGVPINRKNDEAFAYLMDALFALSVEAMVRIRKR